VSGAASHPSKWVITGRWVPEKSDSGQLYTSISYWLTCDWRVGLGYRPQTGQFNWATTYRVLSENANDWKGWKPAIIIGSTSDDFTDGDHEIESRTFFATVSKSIPNYKPFGMSVSPYVGAVWIQELDKIRPLAGLSLRKDDWSLITQYSGTDIHLSLSYSLSDQVSVSGIFWGLKYPGLGLRWRF